MLFAVSVTEKGIVNWVEWFKMRLHKEMIAAQRKVGKIGNSLVGHVFTLVAKHYTTLK